MNNWPLPSSVRVYTGIIKARQGPKVAAQGLITYTVENLPTDPPESIHLPNIVPVRRFDDDEEITAADPGELCWIQVGPGDTVRVYLACPEEATAGPCDQVITPQAIVEMSA